MFFMRELCLFPTGRNQQMQLNGTNPSVCFLESDPQLSLVRRGAAEFIGTLLLVLVILGEKLNASHFPGSGHDTGALALAVAAGAALGALILALGSVSGGHFNPLITLLQWITRLRSGKSFCVYVTAQIAGGIGGAILASTAFGRMRSVGGPPSPESGWVLAELLFSTGLLVVVFGCMQSNRKEFAALAVGTWLMGSSIDMPNAFGNPALALGAKLSLGGVLTWHTVLFAIVVELGGAAVTAAIVALLFPNFMRVSPRVSAGIRVGARAGS